MEVKLKYINGGSLGVQYYTMVTSASIRWSTLKIPWHPLQKAGEFYSAPWLNFKVLPPSFERQAWPAGSSKNLAKTIAPANPTRRLELLGPLN